MMMIFLVNLKIMFIDSIEDRKQYLTRIYIILN
jgi:hypothetical protein